MEVYRIQDKHGRGPFKPGFSEKWVEERPDHENLIPWFNEWPELLGSLTPLSIRGLHCACGCRSLEQLRRWFTNTEYERLYIFGYRAVSINAESILRENDKQCVFASRHPLKKQTAVIDLYA